MWKRRQAEPEEVDDEVVVDLRQRLEAYPAVDPAAVEALREQLAGTPEPEPEPESRWAMPADWLRAP